MRDSRCFYLDPDISYHMCGNIPHHFLVTVGTTYIIVFILSCYQAWYQDWIYSVIGLSPSVDSGLGKLYLGKIVSIGITYSRGTNWRSPSRQWRLWLSKGDNAFIVSRPAGDSRIGPEMLAHHLQHGPNINQTPTVSATSTVICLNCACVDLIKAGQSTLVIESDGGWTSPRLAQCCVRV